MDKGAGEEATEEAEDWRHQDAGEGADQRGAPLFQEEERVAEDDHEGERGEIQKAQDSGAEDVAEEISELMHVLPEIVYLAEESLAANCLILIL